MISFYINSSKWKSALFFLLNLIYWLIKTWFLIDLSRRILSDKSKLVSNRVLSHFYSSTFASFASPKMLGIETFPDAQINTSWDTNILCQKPATTLYVFQYNIDCSIQFNTFLYALYPYIASYIRTYTNIIQHGKAFCCQHCTLELRLCASMKSIHSKARKCKFRSTLFAINCLES
jgi:hypothetical protein